MNVSLKLPFSVNDVFLVKVWLWWRVDRRSTNAKKAPTKMFPQPREANKYFRSSEFVPDFCWCCCWCGCCCCCCEGNLKIKFRLPASMVAMTGPIKRPEMEATMESGTKWRPPMKVRTRNETMLAMQILLKSLNWTQSNSKQWSYFCYWILMFEVVIYKWRHAFSGEASSRKISL